MFGLFALYVNDKIVLMLCQRIKNPEINGVWIATDQAHHKSLKKDFPSIRSISIDVDEATDSNWQLLPVDADDFESSVIKVCEFIQRKDPRIGRSKRHVK